MMPKEQFGVDGCHLDGGRAQCGLGDGDHQGGRQSGGVPGTGECMEYWGWCAGEL